MFAKRAGLNANAALSAHSAIMASTYNLPLLKEPREAMPSLTDLIDRVERMLLRHEELKRNNTVLQEQVQSLSQERDNLRSRLNAARARIDALLDRLPVGNAQGKNPP